MKVAAAMFLYNTVVKYSILGDYRLSGITEPVAMKIDKDIKEKTKNTKEVKDIMQDTTQIKTDIEDILARLDDIEARLTALESL